MDGMKYCTICGKPLLDEIKMKGQIRKING